VMLTTSKNPDDREMALSQGGVASFKTKPLTKDMLQQVLDEFYSQQ
jgi:CheY-like chemotaxis protein